MLDFKVGDYVILLHNNEQKGTITRVIENFWDNNAIQRLPETYEVTWEDKSITIESQWTIDPYPFEPNEILKTLIT